MRRVLVRAVIGLVAPTLTAIVDPLERTEELGSAGVGIGSAAASPP